MAMGHREIARLDGGHNQGRTNVRAGYRASTHAHALAKNVQCPWGLPRGSRHHGGAGSPVLDSNRSLHRHRWKKPSASPEPHSVRWEPSPNTFACRVGRGSAASTIPVGGLRTTAMRPTTRCSSSRAAPPRTRSLRSRMARRSRCRAPSADTVCARAEVCPGGQVKAWRANVVLLKSRADAKYRHVIPTMVAGEFGPCPHVVDTRFVVTRLRAA